MWTHSVFRIITIRTKHVLNPLRAGELAIADEHCCARLAPATLVTATGASDPVLLLVLAVEAIISSCSTERLRFEIDTSCFCFRTRRPYIPGISTCDRYLRHATACGTSPVCMQVPAGIAIRISCSLVPWGGTSIFASFTKRSAYLFCLHHAFLRFRLVEMFQPTSYA